MDYLPAIISIVLTRAKCIVGGGMARAQCIMGSAAAAAARCTLGRLVCLTRIVSTI